MNKEVAKAENTLPVVNAESLIQQAINKNVPIETMEKLLAMRKELKEEKARELFIEAMSFFQEDCPIIEKKKAVYNKDGKTLRYFYAPLESIIEQVKKPLKENGFSYTFKTVQTKETVTAICVVSHIAGHSETTQLEMPIMPSSYMNIAQSVASSLTYAKRYTFCDAFGIATMDTDNDANVPAPSNPQPSKKPPKKTVIDEKINKELFREIVTTLNKKEGGAPVFQESEKLKNIKLAEERLTKKEDLTVFKNGVVKECNRRVEAILKEANSLVGETKKIIGEIVDAEIL
jgi:hypothetical protein